MRWISLVAALVIAGCGTTPQARTTCQRSELTQAWSDADYIDCVTADGVACWSIYSTSHRPAPEFCAGAGPDQLGILAQLEECCRFPNGYSLMGRPGDCASANGECAFVEGLTVQRIATCILDGDRDCDRDWDLVDFAIAQVAR